MMDTCADRGCMLGVGWGGGGSPRSAVNLDKIDESELIKLSCV